MIDAFGSHMPILKWVLQQTRPISIIEFGSGLHSTSFLLDNCKQLTTIESGLNKNTSPHIAKEWYDKVSQAIPPNPKFDYHLKYGPEEIEFFKYELFKRGGNPYNLAFVDGYSQNRGTLVQICLNHRTPIIIAHDTEQVDPYFYGSIKKPDEYIVEKWRPLTSPVCTTIWSLKKIEGKPSECIQTPLVQGIF